MRTRLMWSLVAVLAAAVMLGGCSKPAASDSSTSPATTDAQAPADTGVEPAPVPSAPTPMGTAATSAEWTITVKEVEREDSAGGVDAASGNELVVIKFDLKNGGTTDVGVGPVLFKLTDASGAEFQAAPTGDPKFIFNIEQPIKAGTTREIRIAYEVPMGAGPFTWTYAPFVEGGEAAPAVLEVK